MVFGARELDGVGRALWLDSSEIDRGFRQAASRARAEKRSAELAQRDAWRREFGSAAMKRKALADKEKKWKEDHHILPKIRTSRAKVDRVENNRREKRKSPFAAKRSNKMRKSVSGTAIQTTTSNEKQSAVSSSAGVTFDTSADTGSFESILEKHALEEILLREGYLEEMRRLLRKYPCQKESLPGKTEFWRLVESIRSSTVNAILSIQKWESCFVHPRPFVFRGVKQEPVDYLLACCSTMDYLRLRPSIVHFFKEKMSGNGQISLVRNPLLLTSTPSMLEKEAMAVLTEHEQVFGLLAAKRCTWCGNLPAKPAGAEREVATCRDPIDACERGQFCGDCIQANCGGAHAKKLAMTAISWTCFLCTDAKLKVRQAERLALIQKAKEAAKYKREKKRRQAAQDRVERAKHPKNKKRRSTALRYLQRRVAQARRMVFRKVDAARQLRSLVRKANSAILLQRDALMWLKQRTSQAFEECREEALALQQAEEATAEKLRRKLAGPQIVSMTSKVADEESQERRNNRDSLDLVEEEAERSRIEAEKKKAEENKLFLEQQQAEEERAEPWIKFGERANVRCAIRVVYFEVCLVRIVSTVKNPEIVEVTTHIPSEHRTVERILMHKSQARKNKWKTELLRTLRDKAKITYMKEAKSVLAERVRRAKHLLEHNRKQWHLRQTLVGLGRKAVLHHNHQRIQLAETRKKAERVKNHLKAQMDAKKYFGFIVRRVWKQQMLQLQARQELTQMSNKVQAHLVKQRSILWELYGRASHVKVHLFAQQRAKQGLRDLLSREIEERKRQERKQESLRPIV